MATIISKQLTSPGVKFVDISDKPVEAEVIRNGAKVSPVAIRADLVADFIAPERLDDRLVQQRVIFQSVPTGQRVARGTVVDVVLSSRYLIDVGFVAGSHVDLSSRTIGSVGDIFLADTNVANAVRQAATPADLPEEIRSSIERTAEANNIQITSTSPGRDFTSLFTAVKAAQTFS